MQIARDDYSSQCGGPVRTDLCNEFGVKGYPTLKYFVSPMISDGDKKGLDYQGGRELPDIDTFIQVSAQGTSTRAYTHCANIHTIQTSHLTCNIPTR